MFPGGHGRSGDLVGWEGGVRRRVDIVWVAAAAVGLRVGSSMKSKRCKWWGGWGGRRLHSLKVIMRAHKVRQTAGAGVDFATPL